MMPTCRFDVSRSKVPAEDKASPNMVTVPRAGSDLRCVCANYIAGPIILANRERVPQPRLSDYRAQIPVPQSVCTVAKLTLEKGVVQANFKRDASPEITFLTLIRRCHDIVYTFTISDQLGVEAMVGGANQATACRQGGAQLR